MDTTNEDPKPTDNMEPPKREASACGAGCACNAAGATGKTRWIAGVVVLVVAGVLMARAIVKERSVQSAPAPTGFAALAGSETPAQPTATPAVRAATADAVESDTPEQQPPAVAEPAIAASVKEIAGLAELNGVAADTFGVFVFLPGKGETETVAPIAPMQAAARIIEPQLGGGKIGMFALRADSDDYRQIAAQIAVPGVLAMVKGGGMRAASGEITETKLVQAFVGASSAGGCGPSSGGCGPASAGCK